MLQRLTKIKKRYFGNESVKKTRLQIGTLPFFISQRYGREVRDNSIDKLNQKGELSPDDSEEAEPAASPNIL